MEDLVSSGGMMREWMSEMGETLKGRRCLVTGHTGFKGAWLTLILKQLGAEVIGFSLEDTGDEKLFNELEVSQEISDQRGDIRDFETCRRILAESQPEIVFHLAAQALVRLSYEAPRETFDTNVGGVVNVLEACRGVDSIRAIVVVTSDKCYENRESVQAYRESDPMGGHDPYSASKGAAELVAAAYARSFFSLAGVGLVTARAGNVIGGGDWAVDRIIPDAVRSLEGGVAVPVRNPHAIRPWQHVLDPLFGYVLLGSRLCAESERGALVTTEGWNFAPDVASAKPVGHLMDVFLSAYGAGSWEDLSVAQEHAPHEASRLMLSRDKAWHHLGWCPRWNFVDSVTRTALWYQKRSQGNAARTLCENDIRDFMETS